MATKTVVYTTSNTSTGYTMPADMNASKPFQLIALGAGGGGTVGGSTGAGGGGSSGGGGGGGGARQMHIATCSSCGNEARLPFVPRGDRPVYCSDCFGRQRDGGSSW